MDNNNLIKVLIADDDVIVQIAHRMALESTGRCEVIIANDGAEAIRKAQEGAIDLILMDFNMPIMDGIEATIQIRANAEHNNIPIIGVTSNTNEQIHQRAKTAGMNGVVVKPLLKNKLEQILAEFIEDNVCY